MSDSFAILPYTYANLGGDRMVRMPDGRLSLVFRDWSGSPVPSPNKGNYYKQLAITVSKDDALGTLAVLLVL